MPSYLTDENSPVFTQPKSTNLERNHRFNLGDKDATNGGAVQAQVIPVNEIYESSNSSIHDSEASDANHMMVRDNGTRQTSINSLSQSKRAGPDRQIAKEEQSTIGRSATNGVISLPDRTLAKEPLGQNNDRELDGTRENRLTNAPKEEFGMPDSPYQQDSPTQLRDSGRNVDAQIPPPFPALVPETQMLNPGKPQTPRRASATPTSDVQHSRSSPHRYSSPPLYQPNTIPSANAATPNHLHPTSSGHAIRHRHTLEVPKLAAPRMSRDGQDSIGSTTGRFSPTTGTTPRRASMTLGGRKPNRMVQNDPPRDEVPADEDTLRWQATVRQKRASKRKRKEEEDDDRVLVGTKVDESHANWVNAYNMLTGIRVSVSRTNAKLDRELTDADFSAKQKSTFDVAGNEMVPSAKYDFKFKDYAPWVFRRLRSLFRLDPADYLMSLTGKYILSELGSPGKSGSFFYFSRDYKYIIKTIHHAEHKFMRKILREYYQHVTENPNTLLSQFYGLHRVKTPYGKKIHFVVMNNIFPPHRDIHATFDLKGSTVGRDYKESELAKNPRATLKDLNWLRRQQHLELGMQKKQLFLEQLQKDVVLLKRLHIMDYSLLVGIHDVSRGNEENLRDKTLQVFNPGGEKPAEDDLQTSLLRTPSKLENARKTRELRQMLRQERPIPMGQAVDGMPDQLGESHTRPGFVFNQDDGGFRATHEDNHPADEVYYLGVIDCLTHYGMIKKIEHFWKGLSSDKTQISALPPENYGDRFYNFVEGVTMSPEAAEKDAQEKEQEAARASADKSSRTSRHRVRDIPSMPTQQPPPPPLQLSQSPEAKETIDMAHREARKTERNGASEKNVPDRTLRTAATAPADSREASLGDPILPIVEEGGETSRVRTNSQPDTLSMDKPLPADKAPPPTPPKPNSLQHYSTPHSADSGYAGPSSSSQGVDYQKHLSMSSKLGNRMSRESLNKTLPPLPSAVDAEKPN